MRLHRTVDESTEGPDASLRSCVRFLLDFTLFLKDITVRYCSSAADCLGLNTFCFVLHLSSFLKLFEDTLDTMLRYTKFSASSF